MDDIDLIKVEFTYKKDDLEIIKRYLSDEHLVRWLDYIKKVCIFAEAHGVNPDWTAISWQTDYD